MTALILIIPIVLSGCDSKDPLPMPDISDYNSEAFIPVSEPDKSSSEGESNAGEVTGGFTVRDRKYTFEENDLVVLNVENGTNRNYSIKLHGKYLDENGNVLKEETQTFEGFAAGWKNYFLFRPEIKFDSFTYTLETKEFTGECVADKLEIYQNQEQEFFWKEDLSGVTGVAGDDSGWIAMTPIYFKNVGEKKMAVTMHYIVVGNDGNIFMINKLPVEYKNGNKGPKTIGFPPSDEFDTKWFAVAYSFNIENKPDIPEQLKDNFTVLVAVVEAKWDAGWTNNG